MTFSAFEDIYQQYPDSEEKKKKQCVAQIIYSIIPQYYTSCSSTEHKQLSDAQRKGNF